MNRIKYQALNLLALLLSPLSFTGEAGGGAQKQGGGGGGGGVYAPETVFASLKDWKPSDFRTHVNPEQARNMEVNGETLLHRAIEDGKADITRMLVTQPYNLDPRETNGAGVSAIDLAKQKGGEFDGIFGDIE